MNPHITDPAKPETFQLPTVTRREVLIERVQECAVHDHLADGWKLLRRPANENTRSAYVIWEDE